jgi:Ser/Thr protein kinase RdoA (MazF antagonist)
MEFGLRGDSRISLIAVSENAVYRIQSSSDNATYILRVHRPAYHDVANIVSEIQWMRALGSETDLSIPRAIPTVEGTLVASVVAGEKKEPRHAVLLEYMNGNHPSTTEIHDIIEPLGEITATLHLHAQQWRSVPNFKRPTWDCESILGPESRFGSWQSSVSITGGQRRILEKLELTLRSELSDYGKGPNRFGLIHADIRLANLLVDGSKIHILDFDDCGFGWYLYDLSAVLALVGADVPIGELVTKWTTGYSRVRPLSSADQRQIPTFILLRRLLLIGWAVTHSAAGLASSLGESFIEDTCLIAQSYAGEGGTPIL